MRFGIYAETQCPPEQSHYDLTWESGRQMIHADVVGLDSYSVTEHHFFPHSSWVSARRGPYPVSSRSPAVYLQRAGKYQRPAWRPSQEQKGLDERPLMASQWPSHPW